MARRNQKQNKMARISISCMVFMLVALMSVQIVRLNRKNKEYIAKEAALQEQKADEEARQQELEAYEKYTNSQDYIEDTAQSKLGLVRTRLSSRKKNKGLSFRRFKCVSIL